jgi:hypothetical protein
MKKKAKLILINNEPYLLFLEDIPRERWIQVYNMKSGKISKLYNYHGIPNRDFYQIAARPEHIALSPDQTNYILSKGGICEIEVQPSVPDNSTHMAMGSFELIAKLIDNKVQVTF